MFVSWKTKGHVLRGCLGTFNPLDIGEGLAEYAIASASRDNRFNPIIPHEVPDLHVAVSLLDRFERAKDHLDWILGVHGIIVEFREQDRSYKATFLPEIAVEQGWNKEETIISLLLKSGYKRKPTSDLLSIIKITKYQTSMVSLSYDSYVLNKAKYCNE